MFFSRQLRSRILLNTCYTSLEMHNALQHVNRTAFQDFCVKLLKKLYCIGIATGNVSEETARNIADVILQAIKYKPLQQEHRPSVNYVNKF